MTLQTPMPETDAPNELRPPPPDSTLAPKHGNSCANSARLLYIGKCGCAVAWYLWLPDFILKMSVVGSAVASVDVYLKVPKAYLLNALLNKIVLFMPLCECQQVLWLQDHILQQRGKTKVQYIAIIESTSSIPCSQDPWHLLKLIVICYL